MSLEDGILGRLRDKGNEGISHNSLVMAFGPDVPEVYFSDKEDMLVQVPNNSVRSGYDYGLFALIRFLYENPYQGQYLTMAGACFTTACAISAAIVYLWGKQWP